MAPTEAFDDMPPALVTEPEVAVAPPSIAEQPTAPMPARRAAIPLWEKLSLAAILALSAFLDFWNLSQNGFGNTYYATAVRSMAMNWHNAYFVAFDPHGVVSIDKPPLGFWLQVLSVKIFGFSGVSLMYPQALAGVISVGLLYAIVRRAFSGPAALLAALALAISPLSVVTNRDNTIDSLLAMTTLLAAWLMLRAAEKGSWGWLIACAVCVGLGFNIKMMAAYLAVPALAAVYLLGAARPWRARFGQLAVAGVIMVVISFAWAVSVDLTPAATRPYVDSSKHNSEIELIIGYNGIQRFTGRSPLPTSTPVIQPKKMPIHLGGQQPQGTLGATLPAPAPKPAAPSSPPSPGENGYPGPFRFFQPLLAGQVSWFLPLALLSILVAATRLRPRSLLRSWRGRHLGPRHQQWVMWTIWLVTMMVFFSFAVFVAAYYMVLLIPAICALSGIGLVMLWEDYQGDSWRGWFLPLGLVLVAVQQVVVVTYYSSWIPWLGSAILDSSVVLALELVVLRALRQAQPVRRVPARTPAAPVPQSALVLALLGITLAPAAWMVASLRPINDGGHPLSGPVRSGPFVELKYADPRLIRYLLSHNEPSTQFVLATGNTEPAESITLTSGAPVLSLGGYTGGDPVFTPQSLATAVQENEVRFFLIPASNLTPQQMAQLYPAVRHFQQQLTGPLSTWVAQHCTPVPPAQWNANPAQIRQPGPFQLYDCSPPPPRCRDTAQACPQSTATNEVMMPPEILWRNHMR